MEVAEKYGRFTASDHKDDRHKKNESEHIVKLVGPEKVGCILFKSRYREPSPTVS